jgi:hypothetical protein
MIQRPRSRRLRLKIGTAGALVVLAAIAALVIPGLAGALTNPSITSPNDGDTVGPGARTITFAMPSTDGTEDGYVLWRSPPHSGACDSTARGSAVTPAGATAAGAAPLAPAPLVDNDTIASGSYCYWVQSSDSNTSASNDSSPVKIVYDKTPPNVAITGQPSNPSSSAAASFTFSGAENAPQCQLDAGSFTSCASSSTMSYSGLPEGPHTFTVQSADAVGNVGSDTYSWTVDTTAPVVAITAQPANPTQATTASFDFTTSDGTVQCKLDGGSFSSCSSPKAYAGPLAGGSHTFTVRSTDAAGNVGSDSYTWVVDLTAPNVAITAHPTNPTAGTSAGFTFSGAENAPQCKLDAGSFTGCASATSMAYAGPLADGSHTFTVQSTDAVGNLGSDTYTWSIDHTAPAIVIAPGSKPANPTNVQNAHFTFSGAENPPQCKLDAGSFTACTSSTTMTYSGPLADGSHTFTVQSSDTLGNLGSDGYTWTVDHTAPVVTITSGKPTNPTASTSANFVFAGAENAPQCKLDAGALGACTSTTSMNYSGLADGSHTFTVQSSDVAGNIGSAAYTWLSDDTPPPTPTNLAFSGTAPSIVKPKFFFNGFADALTNPVTYRLDRNGQFTGVTGASSPIIDTSMALDGSMDDTYVYTVRAVDVVLNESPDSNGQTVTMSTGAPSVPGNLRSPAPLTRSAPIISWNASTGSPATYRILRNGALIGTVNAPTTTFSDGALPLDGTADATYTYTVVAVDAATNASAASAALQVTLDTTRPLPASSLTMAQSPTAARPVLIWPGSASNDVAGYNVYRGGTKITATPLQATSFTDGGLDADGTYAYTVRAVDKAGNESSDSQGASVLYDTTAPGTPGASAIAAPSGGTATVNWTPASDAGSGVAGYEVRRSAPDGGPPTTLGEGTPICGSVPPGAMGCADSGLTQGASFRYSVFAIDAVGNVSLAGQAAAITIPSTVDRTPPKAPTGLHAVVANGQITLTWNNPKVDLATVSVVWNSKRAPRTSSDGNLVYRGTGAKIVLKVPGLSAGKQVRFAVYAFDKAGNASPATRATIIVPRPSSVSLAPNGKLSGNPNLTWNPITGATYYNVQVFEGTQASKRVGIAWPAITKYTLPGKDMKKGKTYTWYVWPGIGAKAAAKYGKLIGKVTFIYAG